MRPRVTPFLGFLLALALAGTTSADTAENWAQLREEAQQAASKTDHPKAMRAYEQALVLAREFGPNDRRYRRTLSSMAEFMVSSFRTRKVPGLLETEQAWAEEILGADGPGMISWRLDAGDLLANLGKPEKSQKTFEETLRVALNEGHRDLAQDALRRLAHLYERYGKHEAAVEVFRKLDLLTRDDPDRWISDLSLHALSRLLVRIGNDAEASACYNRLYHRVRRRMPEGDLYVARVREEYEQVLTRLKVQDVSLDLQIPQSIDEGELPPARGWIYHAGENDIPYPELIHRVEPNYPEKGAVERTSGSVVLSVLTDTSGYIRSVELLESDRPGFGFEEAAIGAVAGWQYEPVQIDGVAVALHQMVYVDFKFHRAPPP